MSSTDPAVLRRRRPRRSGVLGFLRDLAVILVVAIVVSWLLKTFLIRSFFIPSTSMEPTLVQDDRILVNELVGTVVPIQRGDVVVFRDPGGWLASAPAPAPEFWRDTWEAVLSFVGLAAPDSYEHLIKRVIGLPGDVVICCDATGRLTVNGEPLDEPYTRIPEGQLMATVKELEVTVPADSLWVMGDNRYNSADSTAHLEEPGGGFVPVSDVVGRAFVITAPFARWAVLDNYPTTFAGLDG